MISRFFNNEPKHLEPMLQAFEDWDLRQETTTAVGYGPMIWEERYIMLLWLSHLLLAPFDLASISSTRHDEQADTDLAGLRVPSSLPAITRRMIPISFKYLVAASKEREAATKLLVRLALRPDMRRAGLLDALMLWALSSLETESTDISLTTIYAHVGILSFLAGICVSADKDAMAPFTLQIFRTIQHLNQDDSSLSKNIRSSALARKTIVKILRALAMLVLQPGFRVAGTVQIEITSTILEESIDHLISDLADKDTPVRYAASKALSVITLKLDSTLATEVIEAVLGTLEEDVLWEDSLTGLAVPNLQSHATEQPPPIRNLTAVNPLKWQGLVLTLAHLLFRRSPPPKMLPSILNALLMALGFEQRSSTGSSFGTNVRDAACFGIWALSRRYTTKELLALDVTSIGAANTGLEGLNVPQVLAVELVVSASLDPSGNIRRGSSAALQELIGRHPDTIREGISLVQVVDYHAVARRSRAVTEVAVGSAKLNDVYWSALFDGLLGWRGIGASDAESRRLAATATGVLSALGGAHRMVSLAEIIKKKIHNLRPGDVELKHGLLMALAAIVNEAQRLSAPKLPEKDSIQTLQGLSILWDVFIDVPSLTEKDLTSSVLRPELIAEGTCCLISSLTRASTTIDQRRPLLPKPTDHSLSKCIDFLTLCFIRTEGDVVVRVSTAAHDLFALLDSSVRRELVQAWTSRLDIEQTNTICGAGRGLGYLAALGSVFKYFSTGDDENPTTEQEAIIDALVLRCSLKMEIESRVAAVRSLGVGVVGTGGRPPSCVMLINIDIL